MRKIVVASVLFVVACNNTPPEGVYPCRQATAAHDCPTLWYCRRDNLCWITDDPDASVSGDGGTVIDAGIDAARDAGPTCTAETCNGHDDDCDGLVDEGVITVGPAVVATGNDFLGAAIVGLQDGFGVLAPSQAMPSTPTWMLTDLQGAPRAAPALGADVAMDHAWPLTATAASTVVLTSTYRDDDTARYVFGFDAATGVRRVAAVPFALPAPSGYAPGAKALFVGAGAGRITLYASYGNGDAMLVRRYRLDVNSAPPSVIDARDVVTDLALTTGWAVIGTTDADFILYARDDGEEVVAAGPSGDESGSFHVLGVVDTTHIARREYATMAIRDPSAPVSASNPLGLAWAGRAGVGHDIATATFAEVTDTTAFASTSPVSFADAFGSWGGFFTANTIALEALPDGPEHWILVNQDSNATPASAGVVQVREIIGAGSSVRRLTLPDELAAGRGDVGMARSGDAIRLVERANGVGLVTRSIGCE